jgi:hypothetical protein
MLVWGVEMGGTSAASGGSVSYIKSVLVVVSGWSKVAQASTGMKKCPLWLFLRAHAFEM